MKEFVNELSNLFLLSSSRFVGFLTLDCSSIIKKEDTISARLLVKME